MTKAAIVQDWLPRYTGRPLRDFGSYILLSNFGLYVDRFAAKFGVEVVGRDRPMPSATANDITIVNFGMGSAMAATVMDLLSAVEPKAVLFLGKCGGFKKTKVGDYILPIAAIRGEGTSNDYLPPEIPALPSVPAPERRLGQHRQAQPRLLDRDDLHDQPPRLGARPGVQGLPLQGPRPGDRHGDGHDLHRRLRQPDPQGGAPPRLGTNPMTPEGVKTSRSDQAVNETFVQAHLDIGIDALIELKESGESVKHLRFE